MDSLVSSGRLGEDSWKKINDLFRNRNKRSFYIPDENVKDIIDFFEKLYSSNAPVSVTVKIKAQVNLIFDLPNEHDEELSGHLGIYPPRSKARDYNGFSQAFIAKLIKGESMSDEKTIL